MKITINGAEFLTGKLLAEMQPKPIKPRPTRRERAFNTIAIPLATQRDVILESDELYVVNVQSLQRSKMAGVVNGNAAVINTWQMEAALRRAHVPKGLAKRMMAA